MAIRPTSGNQKNCVCKHWRKSVYASLIRRARSDCRRRSFCWNIPAFSPQLTENASTGAIVNPQTRRFRECRSSVRVAAGAPEYLIEMSVNQRPDRFALPWSKRRGSGAEPRVPGRTPGKLMRRPLKRCMVAVHDVHGLVAGILQPRLESGPNGRNPGRLDAPLRGARLRHRLGNRRIGRARGPDVVVHGPHDLGERLQLFGRTAGQRQQPHERKQEPAAPAKPGCRPGLCRATGWWHGGFPDPWRYRGVFIRQYACLVLTQYTGRYVTAKYGTAIGNKNRTDSARIRDCWRE